MAASAKRLGACLVSPTRMLIDVDVYARYRGFAEVHGLGLVFAEPVGLHVKVHEGAWLPEPVEQASKFLAGEKAAVAGRSARYLHVHKRG